MNEDGLHAQLAGDVARVLSSGASKTCQNVSGRIIALGLGESPDWTTHGLVGDFDEALGDVANRKRRRRSPGCQVAGIHRVRQFLQPRINHKQTRN